MAAPPSSPRLAWTPLILRLVGGWMFLSAFHRRVLLAPAKLVIGDPAYLGHKFNAFMPGAIGGVGELIAALLDHPATLHGFLWSFTIIEGLVGLALILGLATRLAALGVASLSAGILFGAGWLGPTCLDEWQIGALGIAIGLVLMLSGAGAPSLDQRLTRRWPGLLARPWLRWAIDPAPAPTRRLSLALASAALLVTLATNQIFHGGLWGPLHNDSVRPRIELSAAHVDRDASLRFVVERPAGPETYGAFLVAAWLVDGRGQRLHTWTAADLAAAKIDNRWLVAVHPGAHGLVVPLGARAEVTLSLDRGRLDAGAGERRLVVEDVSGARWEVALDGTTPCPTGCKTS